MPWVPLLYVTECSQGSSKRGTTELALIAVLKSVGIAKDH